MKKILSTLFVSASLCVPSLAHHLPNEPTSLAHHLPDEPISLADHIDSPFFSYDAMNCMKLGECTEGIYELSSDNKNDEIKSILKNLNQMGVKVYEAIPEYFVDEYRALYYSDKNLIFINMGYVDNDETLIKILRHEGWHAAQDCMGGGVANSDLMSILDHDTIPSYVMDETFQRYGYNPTVVRIEREAVWAMKVNGMTVKALKACNSDTPIWETYFPPKRTWQYLYMNGHL